MIQEKNDKPALRASGLKKKFGNKTAVEGIDLEVASGSFFGFLGPNGAGKTTSIRMLTGILSPDSGQILIYGKPMKPDATDTRRIIGVLPDGLALFDNLKGIEHLQLTGRLHGLDRGVIMHRIHELSEILDMKEALSTLTNLCSHGMKKKLSLAAALLHNPRIVFLDEPFEGIDAVSARAIRELLSHIRKNGVTIFLTSHILEIVEKLCDSFAIINNGKILHEAKMSDTDEKGLEEAYVGLVGERQINSMPAWLGHRNNP